MLEPATDSRQLRRRGVRAALRSAALTAIAAGLGATGRIAALGRVARVQVLNFHHVFPDEEQAFRRLLERLSSSFRFVSYGEAVDRVLEGRIDEPVLAFSFDDGLANCRRAAEILVEFGARGCFFVCPGIVGESDEARIRAFCERLLLPPVELLSWPDLEQLLAAGHEVGSHTVNHVPLVRCGRAELEDEVGRSRELLKARLGAGDHFAWPFGRFRDVNPAAVRAVLQAGHRSCASAARGCHAPASAAAVSLPCIRRDTLVAGEPVHHALALLARGAARPLPPAATWPPGWFDAIRGEAASA